MSRSLLLVVCDFLLLSILALARFDVPEGAIIAKDSQKVVSKEVIERISDGENYDDVVAELEATNETLLENLSSDKDALVAEKEELEAQILERQKELADKEKEIASRDQVIAGNEEAIARAQEEASELAKQREEIAKKREELLQSNAASKKELELLAKNLEEAKKKQDELAALKASKEKEAESAKIELAATIEKAKAGEKAAEEAKALLMEEKKRSDALVASTTKIDQKIDSLNQGLAGVGQDLKVVGEGLAGVGDKISTVTKEVSSVKEDVSGVKATVAEVSEEVSGVGSKVETIKKEVEQTAAVQKENFEKLNERQKQSLNEIYTKYDNNKVNLSFEFLHKGGFLGAERKEKFSMDSIILADGSFAYTLIHSQESPFRLQPRSRSLLTVKGQITSAKLDKPIEIREIAFMDDPRIIIIPLYINPQDLAKNSDIEIFSAPQNPYLFSEAVIIDSKERRFGQTNFIRDEKDSRYIKVEHESFAFLTGKFDPAKSDLVFSQKGELLGIMVNNNYAFHVKNLGARLHSGSRTLLGSSFEPAKTNSLLASLVKNLYGLSKKFQ